MTKLLTSSRLALLSMLFLGGASSVNIDNDHCLLLEGGPLLPGLCHVSEVALAPATKLGTGGVVSTLEFHSGELGLGGPSEARLKFAYGRDLFAGLHATFDASMARLLGAGGAYDQRLHLNLDKPIGSRWQTGLETELDLLDAPLARRTGFILLHAAYSLSESGGNQHRLEVKLGNDLWGSTNHAEMRYEFRRDSNILSVGLRVAAPTTRPSAGVEMRVGRKF
ncbi:MAG TPA: hypothetical protein VKT70_06340 [Stellaceae bacterium]|nr:hypothetical protein [Stellaceae bacterium]